MVIFHCYISSPEGKPWDFGAPCRQSHLPGPGACRCLEHRLCGWPEPGMDQRRRPPGTIAKTLWLQGAPTWATAQQETESHSESPQSCWASFDIGFDHDISWSWSNNWPLYWNLEWIYIYIYGYIWIVYRILAPICQQPCLFWIVQVSITDFASLAAVAEGKVWLAGSAMGVTVAQRIIE